MGKMKWDDFVAEHNNYSTCFCASVSATLPKRAIHFDRNNKKLPTPFMLFNKWLNNSITGDWTSTKVSGGFIFQVVEKDDISKIEHNFPPTGRKLRTQACNISKEISYSDRSYSNLAKHLGYSL